MFHVSNYSTFRVKRAVSSTAVFCSESVECFTGMACTLFFKHLVTVPVSPVITGIIIHFMFHIRCVSIRILLRFSFFSASFSVTFLSAGICRICQ
jgi:hypothetical protein